MAHRRAGPAPGRDHPATDPGHRRVTARAGALATEHGHGYVGVEHLLEAILEDGHSVATAAIARETSHATIERHLADIMDSEGHRCPWPGAPEIPP